MNSFGSAIFYLAESETERKREQTVHSGDRLVLRSFSTSLTVKQVRSP